MKLKKLAILSLGAIFGLSLASCDKLVSNSTSDNNASTQVDAGSSTTPAQSSTTAQNDGSSSAKGQVSPSTSSVPEGQTSTSTTTTNTVTDNWETITAEDYINAYYAKTTPNYNWCEVSVDDEKKCYLKYDNNEWYHSPYYTDSIDIYSNIFTWEKLETSHGEYFLQVFSTEGLSQFSGGASINVGLYTIGQVKFIADYPQTDGSYTYNGCNMLLEKSNNNYKTTITTDNGQEIYNNEYFYVTKAIWSGEASHEATFSWNTIDLSRVNETAKYTYTFYDADGKTILKEETIYGGAQIVAPSNPDSTVDHPFDGWYTEKTGGTKVETFSTITGNVSYYARYSATAVSNEWKVITVEEFANCYNNSDNSNYTYNHCFSTINGNDSGRGDHYKVENNVLYMGSLTGINNNEIGEKKEFIDWREFPSPYNYFFLITSDSISYFKNYKELNEGIYTYNDLAYEIQYLRKGNDEYAIKMFAGTNGTVTYYFNKYFYIIADDNTTNGHTYVWDTIDLSKTINVYTYTFYEDDGTTVLKTKTTYEEGTQIVPPNNPTKEATSEYTYEFDGWYTEKTGGTKVETFSTITGNVSYYARYSATPINNVEGKITKKYIFNMSGSYVPFIVNIKDNLVDSLASFGTVVGAFKAIYDSNNHLVKFIHTGYGDRVSIADAIPYMTNMGIDYTETSNSQKLNWGGCELELKNGGTIIKSDNVLEQDEFINDNYLIKFDGNKVTYKYNANGHNYQDVVEIDGICYDEKLYIDDVLDHTRKVTMENSKYINERIQYDADGNITCKNIDELTCDDNYNITNTIKTVEDSTGKTITTTNYTYNESNEIVSGDLTVVRKDLNDNVTDTIEYVYNVETKEFELKS